MKKLISILLVLMMLLTVVSCGKNSEDGEGGLFGGKSGSSEEADGGEDEVDFEIGFTEEKNKLVWSFSEGLYYEIRHDGKNVTGQAMYISYGNHDAAKAAVDTIKAMMVLGTAEDSEVKSISAKGEYVVYEYNESGYEYQTYEEAKEAFDSAKAMLEQAKKAQQ